jgi:hypothetical protein
MPAIDRSSMAPSGCIAVRVDDPEALFDRFDPAAGPGRALDERVEAYIAAKAALVAPTARVHIVLHQPRSSAAEPDDPRGMHLEPEALTSAVQAHFAIRHHQIAQDLNDTTRRGLRYLAVGMSLLTVCMVLGYLGRKYVFAEPYGTFIETGLSVFGWVANWRPVETLLYERRIVQRRLTLYARLAQAEVEWHSPA